MGAYFLVVNPAKRQYLDPGRFGEAQKFSGLLNGEFCLHALKLLIADCFPPRDNAFAGAWLGDPVILASDDSGWPDPGGILTATEGDPHRNLSRRARAEFVDISYRALAELCRNSRLAAGLADRARSDSSLLIDLVAVLEQFQPPGLDHALEEAVGRPWRKAYHEAWARVSYWWILPPIDWPL